MTQPPGPTAPATPPAPPAASGPHAPVPHPAAAPTGPGRPSGTTEPSGHGPDRRAWARPVARARRAAATEPGRLRLVGAALVVLALAFGAVTAWQVTQRASAADAVIHGHQRLAADAAEIHRSLADANTTAAAGFLAGGEEPRAVAERYDRGVDTAAELITRAAASGEGSATARRQLSALNRGLPAYTALVEAARANNRQGLPLGGAYLRYADERMRTELLPAARTLYETEAARYERGHGEAAGWPWASLVLGAATLATLGWAQRRDFARTNRVFNRGLVAASGAAAALLVWLAVAHGVAAGQLRTADRDGARSLHTLNEALVAALEARGDEGMTLVARGGGAEYEETYRAGMARLAGAGGEEGGLLARALRLADDDAGREPVRTAREHVTLWQERHVEARESDNTGEYGDAVAKVIGPRESTGEAFDAVDGALRAAIEHEQRQFGDAAESGRAALTGLAVGAGVLGLTGAAGAVAGVGRRLAEYR
ncbi:hypothetical protein WDH52_07205 [Streptomyces sp. TRM70308]|uniref:hypothetical protein n=1 Tax=Streptomyces sp. TRM70308 TaxID=3131932 RepID=UPI003CFE2D6D